MAAFKLDVIEQYFDNDGLLLAGGLLYFYSAGTSTLTATYTDATGLVAAENPIELDASGRCQTWFLPGAYKAILKDANGVTVAPPVDGIFVADPDAVSPGSQYVDVVFTYPGGPPIASGWIGGETFTRAVTFPANFGGSFGKARTNPTASFVASVRKNSTTFSDGTEVGTVTVATNGTYAFTSTGGAVVNFAAGDNIDAWGPAVADTTLANFGFTLAGSLA